tara:strand:+ start:491 stop:766 length:276 start_codon:yes stop_codon:yes gene_type:complete
MKHDCGGDPSITNYGRGCRCDLCRSVKSLYERERRERANKQTVASKDGTRKPAGKRDNPVVFNDAYSQIEIVRAHPHLDWSDKLKAAAGIS